MVPMPADAEYEAQWWGQAPQEQQMFILVPADPHPGSLMPWTTQPQMWSNGQGAWQMDSMVPPGPPMPAAMAMPQALQTKLEASATPAPPAAAPAAAPAATAAPPAATPKINWCDEPIQDVGSAAKHEEPSEPEGHENEIAYETWSEHRITASAARRLRRKRASERARQADPQPCALESRGALDMEELRWQLESDPHAVAQKMRGHVYDLARDPKHCRILQEVLEKCSSSDGQMLAQELKGYVWDLSICPQGNFTVQKVISHLSVAASEFIAVELRGYAARAAKNRQACRILCRLLEFRGDRGATRHLVDELLEEVDTLCFHSFAHHVIQSVLEHGEARHKERIADALISDGFRFATHKHSSYLMEKVLCYCSPADQEKLIHSLGSPEMLLELAKTQYGSYVARALLRDDRVDWDGAMWLFKQHFEELKQCRHGHRFLSDVGLLQSD